MLLPLARGEINCETANYIPLNKYIGTENCTLQQIRYSIFVPQSWTINLKNNMLPHIGKFEKHN